MRFLPFLLATGAWLGVSACTSAPRVDTFTPDYHSWKSIMENVMDPTWNWHLQPAADAAPQDIDLVDVSTRAERAARYLNYAMQLDPHDDIPDFDEAAIAATRWLLAIQGAANQGSRDALQKLIRGGEERYCDRCHNLLP